MNDELKSYLSPFRFIDHYISEIKVKNSLLAFDVSDVERTLEKVEYLPEVTTDDEEHYRGTVILTIRVKAKRNKESITVQLTLVGVFAGDYPSINYDEFVQLLEVSGVAALYSIARGVIINISSQCSPQGQLRLPTINVMAFNKKRQEQREKQSQDGHSTNEE